MRCIILVNWSLVSSAASNPLARLSAWSLGIEALLHVSQMSKNSEESPLRHLLMKVKSG